MSIQQVLDIIKTMLDSQEVIATRIEDLELKVEALEYRLSGETANEET